MVDLSDLHRLGIDMMGDDIGENGEWAYVDPNRRVNDEFSSINTGDIVLLANIRGGPTGKLHESGHGGYSFGAHSAKPGKGYRSQHGSLAEIDSRVPVAFGNPQGSGPPMPDDILATLRVLFASQPAGGPVPLETPAILQFFVGR